MCLSLASSLTVYNGFKRKEIHINKIRHLNSTQAVDFYGCALNCANHPGNAVSELERCYAIAYYETTKACHLKNFFMFVKPSGDLETLYYRLDLLCELINFAAS